MRITPHCDTLRYGMEALLLHCSVLQQMVSAVYAHRARVVLVVQQLGRRPGGV